MKIGTILIRLRNSRRLTQRDVADYIGVRQNTYQCWESDQTSVKVQYLPKLAEVFGVAVTELLPSSYVNHTGTNQPGPGGQTSTQPLSGTSPDYRDELIAAQKREIELLELRIVDLQSRLSGGAVNLQGFRNLIGFRMDFLR